MVNTTALHDFTSGDFFAAWSLFSLLSSSPYVQDFLKVMLLGTLMESGKASFYWLKRRVRFRTKIKAYFPDGDPAHEWMMLFLMQRKVWQSTCNFNVTTRASKQKWAISTREMKASASYLPHVWWHLLAGFFSLSPFSTPTTTKAIIRDGQDSTTPDYIPRWEEPYFLRWRGYWLDVSIKSPESSNGEEAVPAGLHVTFFTSDTSVLPAFIEEAKENYQRNNIQIPRVSVIEPDPVARFQHPWAKMWGDAKEKPVRPLDTVNLEEGVLDDIIQDVSDFLGLEKWYASQGIPHRRGFLLHGPSGTGKTSTIYAIAGALNLAIYSCSLGAAGMDDDFLNRLASSIPRGSIFLMEDIDCAFPNRDDEDNIEGTIQTMLKFKGIRAATPRWSNITLSGLLNVLDGVGSDEGRLFFATTNYHMRLDDAFLRPGRIDRQIEYKKASKYQIKKCWDRFFPLASWVPLECVENTTDGGVDMIHTTIYHNKAQSDPNPPSKKIVGHFRSHPQLDHTPLSLPLCTLAKNFVSSIPNHTFSIAELQGYLLLHKFSPETAATDASLWVEKELQARVKREEEEAQAKKKRLQAMKELAQGTGALDQGHWAQVQRPSIHAVHLDTSMPPQDEKLSKLPGDPSAERKDAAASDAEEATQAPVRNSAKTEDLQETRCDLQDK